ncbi:MAG: zinc-ribbon and FHA domain-containing protein [Coriobacteriia bacterium]|nr:zinc-ribbon and FHA domain-containing protein [Coriobacteriia bacterium]
MNDCPRCGAQTAADVPTCPECGARLEGATESFAPVGVEETPESVDVDAGAGPVLVVRKGPEVGERFYIDRERLTVGRDPRSDIFLNDVTVSRNHAVLTSVDGVQIEDVGSLNGTYVNGVCVDKGRLEHGDSVQIGMFQMVFLSGKDV